MNQILAGLLALSLFAPTAQARDNDTSIGDAASNPGLQTSFPVNSWRSLSAPVMVRRAAGQRHGAGLSWALAALRMRDKPSIRVVRARTPVFAISDYHTVGDANAMLRASAKVCPQTPVEGVASAGLAWRPDLGNTSPTAQLAIGAAKTLTAGHFDVHGKNMVVLDPVAGSGPFLLRAGHARTQLAVGDLAMQNSLVGSLRATDSGLTCRS